MNEHEDGDLLHHFKLFQQNLLKMNQENSLLVNPIKRYGKVNLLSLKSFNGHVKYLYKRKLKNKIN